VQLTLGRRWIVTLEFKVRLARLQESCSRQAARFVATDRRQEAAELRWERDRLAGQMLSGWGDHYPAQSERVRPRELGPGEVRAALLNRWWR
jgi:hypothetical protein